MPGSSSVAGPKDGWDVRAMIQVNDSFFKIINVLPLPSSMRAT
jgi:hypothetical protein